MFPQAIVEYNHRAMLLPQPPIKEEFPWTALYAPQATTVFDQLATFASPPPMTE